MESYDDIERHPKRRMRERSSKSKRQNELALQRGVSYKEFSGSFRRYLDKVRLKKGSVGKIIVYDNNVFLYDSDEKLITVLNIPSKYLKYLTKD
ncbi:MAG: hypothetical protein KAX49_07325 [Halanaerobiales bacterium]|nr:hypothetical protein [Halanaerobiales bacterium]